MKSYLKSEVEKSVKLGEIECFTADQIRNFTTESYNEINKSIDNDSKERQINEVALEVKSFSPIEVTDDVTLMKSILFIREAQIAWNEPVGDDIQKSRTGRYLNTELNRKLGRVGKEYGEDNIEKGNKAVVGEIRTWGNKKYKKQPNGKWVEVSESHGMTKEEHQKKSDAQLKGKGLINRERLNIHIMHGEAASKLSDKEYSDEELNKSYESDIEKGKKANIGEVRYYGGIPYRKVAANGNHKDWERVQESGKTQSDKDFEFQVNGIKESHSKYTDEDYKKHYGISKEESKNNIKQNYPKVYEAIWGKSEESKSGSIEWNKDEDGIYTAVVGDTNFEIMRTHVSGEFVLTANGKGIVKGTLGVCKGAAKDYLDGKIGKKKEDITVENQKDELDRKAKDEESENKSESVKIKERFEEFEKVSGELKNKLKAFASKQDMSEGFGGNFYKNYGEDDIIRSMSIRVKDISLSDITKGVDSGYIISIGESQISVPNKVYEHLREVKYDTPEEAYAKMKEVKSKFENFYKDLLK